MKSAIFAVACAAALGASPALAAGAAAVEAPIHQFIDNFDKGDAAGAAAAFLPSVAIIDEVPPHLWTGSKAFATWAADLAKDDMAHGISGEAVTLGAVKREVVSGKTAYVIMAATYSFKQNGMDMHEVAQMTFALQKAADGWKIAAWTWTGPKASVVKTSAK